jgi:signal transduction histidine kinase
MTTSQTKPTTPGRAKILYIEDNPLNAQLVQRVLGAEGYTVHIAPDGLKGIDAAIEHKPDLILMDINLPDMSGREVTSRLRYHDEFKTVPIVALTAQTDEKQRAMTVAAGVDGYITKPFELEELVQRVAFHLAGGKEQFKLDLVQAQREYNQELILHLERQLRDAQAANEELKRLDRIKDDFIQRVAHELRTPLTIIYGYSRLIQTAQPLQGLLSEYVEVGAYVDGLVESIERMHILVNEILTIYRIATGKIQPKIGTLDMRSIVSDAVTSFTQAASQRNIMLEYQRDEWPKAIQIDGDLLKLVFTNLIGNAIKYTPDGGKVTLKAEQTTDKLVMRVIDTGIGIPKEDQERIFDRFYSGVQTETHSTSKTAFKGGGLGLGLSISRGIIAAHNGSIRVESSGKDEEKLPGSIFIIELPLTQNAYSQPPTSSQETATTPRQGTTEPTGLTTQAESSSVPSTRDDNSKASG